MKKTIGIILREYTSDYKDIKLYGFRQDIVPFLRKYEINIISIPVMFRNENEFDKVKEIVDFCDAIIFPGGSEMYNIDYKIIKYLYEMDKPTLGVCLGFQIMAKAFNGKDRVLIESGNHASEEEYVHSVTIKKDSLLYKIIGEENIKVNSRHTKKVPYTELDCVAFSDDGILEAVEAKDKKFFIGIQWHPESLLDDVNSKKFFDYFIASL